MTKTKTQTKRVPLRQLRRFFVANGIRARLNRRATPKDERMLIVKDTTMHRIVKLLEKQDVRVKVKAGETPKEIKRLSVRVPAGTLQFDHSTELFGAVVITMH